MNVDEIINININDLSMALELAEVIDNDSLKDYANERLEALTTYRNITKYLNSESIVDSYVIDLKMLISISSLTKELDSKDYYKNRLVELIKNFSFLKKRSDLVDIL